MHETTCFALHREQPPGLRARLIHRLFEQLRDARAVGGCRAGLLDQLLV